MDIVIDSARLSGRVRAPASKSQCHRLLLCAALAPGESRLEGVSPSRDIEATLRCLKALGAGVRQEDGALFITGVTAAKADEPPLFDCGESGSTLRFMIPIALALRGGGRFTGQGRLMERPQEPYCRLFREKGVAWEKSGGVLTVRGRLRPGGYALPGNVSSQFFTGLLLALPLLEGESTLRSTTPIESADYIAMTQEAMAAAGVCVAAALPVKARSAAGSYRALPVVAV